ncbi:hypothetical protein ACH5RR_034083 [Cinchona calisaya]|uniref:Uncharacterized protein n=1 Tax=Cinchona calisaya TaxID=153742 RepID=A0ABD2YEE7_9GENT
MALDDSFKRAGAIPFKWEDRPGVPKIQAQLPEQHQQHQQQKQHFDRNNPSLVPQHKEQKKQQKLAPPPAGFYYFQPQMEPRTRSFLSAPRTRSERYRFYSSSTLSQPESVLTSGCFPSSPLLISRKYDKKKTKKHKLKVGVVEPESEPECGSDLETLSRWSVSTRKSLSPFKDSPLSSSFSSHQSSPRPLNDAEWAGYGLF